MQKRPLAFLMSLSQRYDKLAYFKAGSLPVFAVHHPDGVKLVLQERARSYSKDTIQYRALATITGRGLLTSDGDHWHTQRRLAQPAFSKARIDALHSIVVPAVEGMLTRWDRACQTSAPVDVDAEMMKVALEIVGRALFGVDLSHDAPRLGRAVLTVLDHIVYRARNVIVPPAFVPTPGNLRFRFALRTLDEAVREFVDKRRRSGELGNDLLGMLLRARDEHSGASMTDTAVRDEVLTALIAGHETVASALTWTMHLLGKNPWAQRRLHEEVSSVLGAATPASDWPSRLVYTGQVFSEALRLYPPAWVITRKAIQDEELFGHAVPAGSLVIISPYVVHRLPDLWDEPDSFAPDRFAPERVLQRHRYAYIPFGAGPRLCIGKQFAETEAKLILAMVSQRYWLEPARDDPVMLPLVTLRPDGGMPMRLRRSGPDLG